MIAGEAKTVMEAASELGVNLIRGALPCCKDKWRVICRTFVCTGVGIAI